MTILEAKSVRDSHGIDTFERGFVYAALLLRASNTHPQNQLTREKNKYYNSVRIAFDLNKMVEGLSNSGDANLTAAKPDPSIIVQATIPYDSNLALRSGGSFLRTLLEYGNYSPYPFLYKAEPTSFNKLIIYKEPSWVNTVEKYLAWCAVNLVYGYNFLSLTSAQQPLKFSVLEENALEPSLLIEAELPFNYYDYSTTGNILQAMLSVIDRGCELETSSSDNTQTILFAGNEFQLSNSQSMSN